MIISLAKFTATIIDFIGEYCIALVLEKLEVNHTYINKYKYSRNSQ
jgi:hypothetical protein